MYRHVTAAPGWWGELDGYRERSIAQLSGFIDNFHPAIDEVRAHLGD